MKQKDEPNGPQPCGVSGPRRILRRAEPGAPSTFSTPRTARQRSVSLAFTAVAASDPSAGSVRCYVSDRARSALGRLSAIHFRRRQPWWTPSGEQNATPRPAMTGIAAIDHRNNLKVVAPIGARLLLGSRISTMARITAVLRCPVAAQLGRMEPPEIPVRSMDPLATFPIRMQLDSGGIVAIHKVEVDVCNVSRGMA